MFDKELIINGKVVRSPEQQVFQNMKDIEELQEIVKKSFTTSATLTSSSVSVAINTTNAPEGTTGGWLYTQDAKMFKITGGDDTNLLIEFYADFRGPQGADGSALNIDDSSTSLTKVWSSSKTNSEINALIDDTIKSAAKTWSSNKIDSFISSGIAWTTTDAVGGTMALNTIYLGGTLATNVTIGDPKIKTNDLIIYVDNDLVASKLYRVTTVGESNITVSLVCEFAPKKHLYIHHVLLKKDGTFRIMFYFIDDNATAYDSTTLKQKILNYGRNIMCTGAFIRLSANYAAINIETSGTTIYLNGFPTANGNSNLENITLDNLWSSLNTISDVTLQIL